jgi:hypothetical protein
MKAYVISVCAVLSFAAGFARDLQACGDKYIVPIRATRFERPPAPRQAAEVLFLVSPGTELSTTLASGSVISALQKAGVRPTLVDRPEEFASALKGQWNIIVIDFGNLRMISNSDSASVADRVVPVSYTLTSDQWKSAKKQYPAILRAPKRAGSFLDGIDAALEAQRAARSSDTRNSR